MTTFELTHAEDLSIPLEPGELLGPIVDLDTRSGWQLRQIIPPGEPVDDCRNYDDGFIVVEPSGLTALTLLAVDKVVSCRVVSGSGWAHFLRAEKGWNYRQLVAAGDGRKAVEFRKGDCWGFAARRSKHLVVRTHMQGYQDGDEEEVTVFTDWKALETFRQNCDVQRRHQASRSN